MKRRVGQFAAISALTLVLALVFKSMLTQTMALHMLVHIPLILFSGIFAGAAASALGRDRNPAWLDSLLDRYARYNEFGVPGLLAASFAGAFWMIPKALDDVLVSVPADIMKFVGLFIAGLVLFDSLRRSSSVIKLFFVGNFSWMSAIVGLLYQENPERLCNFYLLGDQELAGRGLVAIAILLPVLWLWTERQRVRRFFR
ncbi:hypothetical protein [Pollutimonas thiosulfatoxidans]|uniref:Uncharacterized protein n=1 Tax=Pollutimonas thiosulfatoxidans TaxID=2028345 RepID=A0A410G841_9BURK|nr:hypothetical protein [Pollutimonas thiosulfatoxidans]QAA92489.1 hypothetical protein CKA81_00475 [Pollutimonas thiosulfatoxidans]